MNKTFFNSVKRQATHIITFIQIAYSNKYSLIIFKIQALSLD